MARSDSVNPPAPMPPAHAAAGREGDGSVDIAGRSSVSSRLGVLRHPAYRNVWLGALVSNTGTWMEGIGVQWLMAEQTGSAFMMGALAAAQFGPILLLGIVGGVAADRVNRKKLLLGTQLGMMFIAALLAVAAATGRATPMALIGLSLLQGVVAAFNYAAWQVLTPRLVPREELPRAIALNGMQFNMARVVGPALGGAIMAQSGAAVLFVINAASFVGVLLAIAGTPDAPVEKREESRRGLLGTVWDDMREPVRWVFSERGPRAVFLGLVVFSLLAGPVLRLLPLFVSEALRADERVFGLLMGVMGFGAVAGGFALKAVPAWYPRHHLIPLSLTLGGASILAFSASTTVALSAVAMLFVGVFWLWSFSVSQAAMQLLVDERMRGRALSICNTAVFGALPLGSLLAGGVGRGAELVAGRAADVAFEVRWGVGALAAGLVAAGLVMLVWRTPEVDNLLPGEPGHRRRPSLFAGITASGHRPRAAPEPAGRD